MFGGKKNIYTASFKELMINSMQQKIIYKRLTHFKYKLK